MTKIRRRCKCGCGNVTNYGRKWIVGHHMFNNKPSKKTKKKISLAHTGKKLSKEHKLNLSLAATGRKYSEETKKKIGLSKIGNANTLGYKHTTKTKQKMSLSKMGNANSLGYNQSEEHKLKISLSNIKHDPNYEYCDIWKDKEYRDDLRKDYCENINCKSDCKRLCNHHIYLDKKKCAPNDIITLCNSCHTALHKTLQQGKRHAADPKNYIIINRPDTFLIFIKHQEK